MKSVKTILSGKLPKRGEKGFTLVELLIVLAILAVLAAVVIPSVTGMFGRGSEQALDTDRRTVQTAVATFFFDVHAAPDDTTGWDGSGLEGHYYPTADGKVATDVAGDPIDIDDLVDAANLVGDAYFVDAPAGTGAIWMGLLVNAPGFWDTDPDGDATDPGYCSPQGGEKGPYLQEWPKSASANNGNPSSPAGTYTWVVVKEAKVYALYWDADAGEWVAGSAGTYP